MSVGGEAPSLPLRSRPTLVLAHLLAALAAVGALYFATAWLASRGALSPKLAHFLLGFASVPVVLASTWSVGLRWDDRVELYADRLMSFRRGRPEGFLLTEVARIDARLGGVRGGLELDTPVGLRVVMDDGRVLAIRGISVRQARPLLQLVGAVLLKRWYATLRRGWSVVCRDAPVFPWALTALVTVLFASAGATMFLPAYSALWSSVRLTLLVTGVLSLAVRAWRTWWQARRTGGVEMSLAGVLPLSEVNAPGESKLEPAAYRAASTLTRAWTPWPNVGDMHLDGYGLRVQCANRAEPLVLSGRTENFFVVNEFIQVMRAARLTKGPALD